MKFNILRNIILAISTKIMSTISEDELESQNLSSNVKKPDRKPTGDDPISDQLLRTCTAKNAQPALHGRAKLPCTWPKN